MWDPDLDPQEELQDLQHWSNPTVCTYLVHEELVFSQMEMRVQRVALEKRCIKLRKRKLWDERRGKMRKKKDKR
jgi:hypothetical protein